MIVTNKLTMDLVRRGVTQQVDAVQDDRYSRNMEITLYSNGVSWGFPDDCTVAVSYVKPDGTVGKYDTLPDGTAAWSAAGNVLTVALAPQVLTCPGLVSMHVHISTGEAVLSTFEIQLVVQRNPAINAESEDYINVSGVVKPVQKTEDMTQPVGVDVDGKLWTAPSESGGVSDYTELTNKPKINGVEVSGNKTSADFGIGDPTDEQVATAVQGWLDEHPEATTTVEDGSITAEKLAADVKQDLYENICTNIDTCNIFEGYALDGNGGYVEDANSKINVYKVTQGDSIYLKLTKDNDGVYQFQWKCDLITQVSPSYLTGAVCTEAVDGMVEVLQVFLLVSMYKTNTENLVQSVSTESICTNNRETIDRVKINGISIQNSAIEQFIIDYNDNIRKIDLNSSLFLDSPNYYGGFHTYNSTDKKGHLVRDADYSTVGKNILYLEKGDKVITNIDSAAEVENQAYMGKGVIMSAFHNNGDVVEDESTIVYADGTYTGAFRTIEIQSSGNYCFSFKKNVPYENKMYIYHAKEVLFDNGSEYQDITSDVIVADGNVTWNGIGTWGETVSDNNGATGRYKNKSTNILSFENMEGYSLLIDGYDLKKDNGIAVVYYENADDTESKIVDSLVYHQYLTHDFITVPLRSEKINFRVLFSWEANTPYVKFRIVSNEYLFKKGMASRLFYGKKILAFGDSYVAGQGIAPVWYQLIALRHYGVYSGHGYGGAGLCSQYGNTPLLSLLSELDEEADMYFLTCGRNDSSGGIPIGENSDVWDGVSDPWTCSFKGGLNYMYNYILEKHPNATIIAVTPWAFKPLDTVTTGLDSIDYIEAIKLISEKYGIYCLNAAQRCGIYVRSEAFRTEYFKETNDYSHLNVNGHALMYNRAKEILESELYTV